MPTIQYVQGQPFLIPDEVTELPTGTQPALPVTQDWYPAGYDNQPQAQLPAQPDMWATVARAGKKLLGVGGEERYQTWPERTIRSALTLPAEVMQGTVQTGPGLRREDVTDIPGTAQPLDPLMERAQDVAGLAGGTMFAGVKPGVASLGAGPVKPRKFVNYLQLDNFLNKSKNNELKGLIDDKGDIHFWDAYDLTHAEAAKKIGINYDIDNRLFIRKSKDEPGYSILDFDDKWTNKENILSNPQFLKLLKKKNILVNVPGQGLITGPEFINLFSESGKVGAPLAALEKAPMFYSNVENAVKGSKQNVASKEQWLSYLKNQPGVKPEELEWTVGNLPEGKITKQQLEQHIAENKMQFNEVWKESVPKYQQKLNEFDSELTKKYGEEWVRNENVLSNEEKNKLQELRNNRPQDWDLEKPKYLSYQLPGGENYRELLLTLPHNVDRRTPLQTARELFKNPELKTIYDLDHDQMRLLQKEIDNQVEQGKQLFRSSHWDEPNVLAHVRMNDRNIPDVGKSLHIEEIQSDWHQAGRKQGYKLPEKEKLDLETELENTTNKRIELQRKLKEQAVSDPPISATKEQKDLLISLQEKEGELGDKYNRLINDGVPNAPFKKTWDELALKRTINEAVRNGYDAISWTPGEAQAARYDLSKHVNELHYQNRTNTLTALDHNGRTVIDEVVPKEKVSDYIGKEAAEKLFKTELDKTGQHLLEGEDLKVGGEGMKAFYDKMMVDKANALAKKHGAKVETKDLNTNPKGWHIIPPDQNVYGGDTWLVKSNDYNSTGLKFWSKARAEVELEKLIAKEKKQPVHVLKLTPELKKAVSEKGFPLFTGGIPHVPPPEEPTFDERWRERVPDEMMKRDEIKDLLEQQKIRNLPLDYTPPERKFEGRPVHLSRVDFIPEF